MLPAAPRADESRLFESVMEQLKSLDAKISAVAAVAPSAVTSARVSWQAMWNPAIKRFSVVPAGYVLPVKVLDAFTHWHCRTVYGEYVLPPLRTLSALDFEAAAQRTWSEIAVMNKYLFQKLTPELQSMCMAPDVSPQSVQAVFGRAMTLNLWTALRCKTASSYANRISHACKLIRKMGEVTKKRARKK